ncbi:MAG: hypothetical protein GOMPHAMPRED_006638 [Gomphillus americanus]|uniref:Uncharacterized protein n=1 Tax=Gomphillus americanus TaxID=1940652 RepID=A0A8H3FYY5_9LECA|nr:MAG: hypothetical protein GOMPHAMPRED_006638 [Gomphillus americanus]
MGMDQVLSAIVNGLEAQNSGKKRAAAEALQAVEQLAESPWALDLVDDFLRACFSAFLLEIASVSQRELCGSTHLVEKLPGLIFLFGFTKG